MYKINLPTQKTRIYLAARYSRAEEMRQAREQLITLGYEVVCRWINGNHQIGDGLCDEEERAERIRFANEDWQDVLRSDVVISFTEEPRTIKTRGGRHVEFGIALALDKVCLTVGPRENIFHWLPQVRQFDTWEECLTFLGPRLEESKEYVWLGNKKFKLPLTCKHCGKEFNPGMQAPIYDCINYCSIECNSKAKYESRSIRTSDPTKNTGDVG